MRLQTISIEAKDVPVDTFIFIPKENRFFFVDDKDHVGKKIIFYFEIDVEEEIKETTYIVNQNKMIEVVSYYTINKDNFHE